MSAHGQGRRLVALAWGFAESILFFVVPDVWISWLALRDLREALVATLLATAGAVLGGAIMYVWGATDPASATAALDWVPAVSLSMIERVEGDLERTGLTAMFVGAFIGTPYKIYAVKSAAVGIGMPIFLLVTIPARLTRFVLVALLARGFSQALEKRLSLRTRMTVHALFWILFYALFISLMPS